MRRMWYLLLFLIITSCSGDLEKIEYDNPLDPSGTNPPVEVNVSTPAGTGVQGSSDGTGGTASFYFPFGLAIDSSRVLYIADTDNHKIRKIVLDPNPVVSTYAGSGTAGSVDGTGSGASFNYPFSVAVDSSGDVYVADKNNHNIRVIYPGGNVDTYAGSGTPGDADGTGTAASFNNPVAVAVDSSGNVYVADQDNNKIKVIAPGGVVTTLAGSGTAIYKPKGVAVDSSGNVYVSDETHVIRKITPSGAVTTFAGSGVQGSVDGYRTGASFNYPWGLTVDSSGNIFVADQQNHVIRKITPEGFVLTYAGLPGASGSQDGVSSTFNITTARFNLPTGVAFDSTSGNVFAADMNNHKIRIIFR